MHYGKAGGASVTGNEDGARDAAMSILCGLRRCGYTIPPEAAAGWIRATGPEASRLNPGSGGPETDFTNRSTTIKTRNLLHTGHRLKDAGGIPRTRTCGSRGTAANGRGTPRIRRADDRRGETREGI